jgi:hypothetical protein
MSHRGFSNALKLTLAPKVGLELGEDAEHIEEAPARGRAGVDRLAECWAMGPRKG